MEWKDTTSYSRGGDQTPHCWTVKNGRLQLTVLDSHIYYPGKWVMHFRPFYDTHELSAKTLEQAQHKAIEIARKEIDKIILDLEKLTT